MKLSRRRTDPTIRYTVCHSNAPEMWSFHRCCHITFDGFEINVAGGGGVEVSLPILFRLTPHITDDNWGPVEAKRAPKTITLNGYCMCHKIN